ncbi:MAG: UDP-N-acetylmuramate dehydrogenase [Burkholderiaceae bacterium]
MAFTIRRDVSLEALNTFGIAARARCFARIETIEDLQALRERPEWADGPRLILGGGSNLLFTRDFDGLVAHVALTGRDYLGDDGDHHLVSACAGENWDAFVRHTLREAWPGLENLALIPGSVGAAPVQNIGAYGVELVERFAWLEFFDLATGRVARMNADACGFAYRDSAFKRELRGRVVITRVVFRLPKRWEPRIGYGDVRAMLEEQAIDRPTALDVADVVTAIRRAKLPDPAVIGNAGSFFKNPIVTSPVFDAIRACEPNAVGYPQADGCVKLAAAWLIDRCGWRGHSLPGASGRAAVHDRQALVLVNRGGATGAEVLALASAIAESVAARFGVALEPEPVIV